jgi:hypothetical protein
MQAMSASEGDSDYNNVVNCDDYALIDFAFNSQTTVMTGPGGGGNNSRLIEIAQMPHFTQAFMNHFIDWNAARGVVYTADDFFPDGVPW